MLLYRGCHFIKCYITEVGLYYANFFTKDNLGTIEALCDNSLAQHVHNHVHRYVTYIDSMICSQHLVMLSQQLAYVLGLQMQVALS